MTTYTPAIASALVQAQSGDLSLRVQFALLQKCSALYAGASQADLALIFRIIKNPAGYANQILPLAIAVANVAATGTVAAPLAPTDAEITTAINTLWPVVSTLGA